MSQFHHSKKWRARNEPLAFRGEIACNTEQKQAQVNSKYEAEAAGILLDNDYQKKWKEVEAILTGKRRMRR